MRPFDLLRTKCLEEGCGTTLCDVLKLKIPKSVGYLNGTLHGLSLLVGCRPLLFTGIRVVLVVPTSLVHLWKYFHPRFHHELIFFQWTLGFSFRIVFIPLFNSSERPDWPKEKPLLGRTV